MSWKTLEVQQPELATFGAERLHGKVAYLATIRKDGSPRVIWCLSLRVSKKLKALILTNEG
jgi:hypothetical protein